MPLLVGQGDQYKSDDEQSEHDGDLGLSTLGCSLEFFPDEDAPDHGNDRRSVALCIRDGRIGCSCTHETDRHTAHPDQSSEKTDEMRTRVAFDIILRADFVPGNGMTHGKAVEERRADQNTDGKEEDASVRREGSRSSGYILRIDGFDYQSVEEHEGDA